MSLMDLFGISEVEGNNNHLKNVVLIDVSYFAQRTFHGQFQRGERVNHISMRYTLLFTILIRLRRLNINPSTHEIIFCYDGNNYWQKVVSPYYKCRRKDRKPDGKDWDGYREYMDSVRDELKKYYPFMILQFKDIMWYQKETDKLNVSGIEADDVIGVLAKRFSLEGRNVIVMTGDGDFTQLDYLDNLSIYDFESKKIVAEHGCGAFDLVHKIVNGDAKDDVANINSRSNYWETRVDGERQDSAKALARQCCEVDDPLTILNEEQQKRYIENRVLKDFNFIPRDLVDSINEKYDNYIMNKPTQLYQFMYDLDVSEGLIQENLKKMIMELV